MGAEAPGVRQSPRVTRAAVRRGLGTLSWRPPSCKSRPRESATLPPEEEIGPDRAATAVWEQKANGAPYPRYEIGMGRFQEHFHTPMGLLAIEGALFFRAQEPGGHVQTACRESYRGALFERRLVMASLTPDESESVNGGGKLGCLRCWCTSSKCYEWDPYNHRLLVYPPGHPEQAQPGSPFKRS